MLKHSAVTPVQTGGVPPDCSSALQPVTVGVGTGFEDRIMENRRLIMKDGTEIDVRHAYSLPPDEEVGSVGPVDPQIGILRLNKKNGETLAVVYNFAMHPIQGAASGGNTADITGFSSKVIEENLADGSVKDISHKSRGRPPEMKQDFVFDREKKKAELPDGQGGECY